MPQRPSVNWSVFVSCVTLALVATRNAHANLTLSSVSAAEIVDDNADGAPPFDVFPVLARTICLGPSAECRVAYEFDFPEEAQDMIDAGGHATFSVVRMNRVSVCAGLSPCPDPTRVSIYGYSGDGVVQEDDFDAGVFLTDTTEIPLVGSALEFDVTPFLRANVGDDFVGFTLRTETPGALKFGNSSVPTFAQLVIVPEPSALGLALLGLAGLRARRG